MSHKTGILSGGRVECCFDILHEIFSSVQKKAAARTRYERSNWSRRKRISFKIKMRFVLGNASFFCSTLVLSLAPPRRLRAGHRNDDSKTSTLMCHLIGINLPVAVCKIIGHCPVYREP